MDIFQEFGSIPTFNFEENKPLNVGICGSFHRYDLLKSLQNYLIAHRYSANLSTDLEQKYNAFPDEDNDCYNLRISKVLINTSNIIIFVIFKEKPDEQNINQSVSQEAQYLYDTMDMRSVDPPHVLVMVEDGAKPASLFKGLVKSHRQKWKEAPFSTSDDLQKAAKQFCANIWIDISNR